MAEDSRYQQAAQFLYQAHRDRRPYENLPESFRPSAIDEAYAMQEAFKDLVAAERGSIAGYKIALTTPVMQRMVGYDAPCFGSVFESGVHRSPANVTAAGYGVWAPSARSPSAWPPVFQRRARPMTDPKSPRP